MANQITIDILANTRGLTTGVNQINSQLGGLNRTVGAVRNTFRGLLGTLGLTVGATALTQWVKDAASEEAEFKRLAANFGKDTESIAANVNSLSQEFKVDDGAIASYFNTLSGKVQVGNNEVLKDIVKSSLEASARFGQPAENYISGWIRILKDGKIKASEVGLVGAALRDKDAQKAFNELTTTTERIAFLQERIGEGLDVNALISPYQELTFELDQLKEAIGEELLPLMQEFLDVIFPKDEEGRRSLASWVDELAKAILIFYGAKGVLGVIKVIKDLRIAILELGGILAASSLGTWLITTTAGATTLTEALGLLWAALSPTKKVLAIAAVLIGIYNLLPDEVQESIKKAFKAIGELMLKAIKEIPLVKAFTERFDEIKEAWQKKDWKSLGIAALKAIVLGLIPVPESMQKEFVAIYKEIRKSWNDRDWSQLGKDIVLGIIKGLVPQPLEAPIKSLAAWAVRVWKKATGSNSPSKVFAGYGVNLVEGLAIGIDKSQGLAARAINSLADTVMSPMDSLAFAGIPSNNNRGNVINVTINAGVGTDAYELGRVVQAALNKYNGVNGARR